MDWQGLIAYLRDMRLLLLISALLAALTGAGGTRAVAQPVQASAAVTASAGSVISVPAARQVFAAGLPTRWPVQAPLPRVIGAVAARILYAERRRE